MPLAGSLDIRALLDDAPTVELDRDPIRIDDVEILQVLYEIGASDAEGLLPPALNPTIPPVVSLLVYRAEHSPFGPLGLVQARLTARAGVRPRTFLVSACCDNPAASEALSRRFGFRIRSGEVRLRRFHDRVECVVTSGRQVQLRVALVDPEPITGHDIQYAPGMHLSHVRGHDGTRARLIQVDTEYEFRTADRGRPELNVFDGAAWGDERIVPLQPISASVTRCDLTIMPVDYVCNPDLPAAEGTEKIADA